MVLSGPRRHGDRGLPGEYEHRPHPFAAATQWGAGRHMRPGKSKVDDRFEGPPSARGAGTHVRVEAWLASDTR
ncbi:hypothetical protein GCM10009533_11630 [Saccharopolyspora spinosporotrichia]|uniref:Uncharacterized protein n=1 Tax=Saccharopolyspora erythraea TaxID=1836 RepID=A0ABN1CA30_SACER